jgi:diphthamide biosynthesis protein 2
MTTQTQPPVLSTPEAHLFDAPTSSSLSTKESRLSDAEILNVYEIERTAREIQEGKWRRVALQFPDSMLVDAPRVFARLEKLLLQDGTTRENRIRLYVLADTSYGSCCVDEVAAEHVDAEVVVHYGRACLSPTSRLPVIYVYTTRPLEVDAVVRAFEESFGEEHDDKIVIMADLTYQSHVPELVDKLRERGWNIRGTEVVHNPTASIPNRNVLWEGEAGDLKEWKIWHIGDPPAALLLTLSSRINELLIYPASSPSSSEVVRSNTSMQLRRRYALLTRLTTTPIIGILINTLSVKNYLASIDGLKKLIDGSGKKSYTFVVGKVNAAKMANFGEVGGWVVVGCWESSLVESSEFYAPVVTPFELSLALESDETRIWSGNWRGDFEGVIENVHGSKMNGSNGHIEVENGDVEAEKVEEKGEDKDEDSEEESAPPEFDLRTGRYVSHSRPMRRANSASTPRDTQDSNTASAASKVLTRRPKQELATINGAVSPGAEFLRSQRTWTGLGSDFDTTEQSGTIEEGRSGVARGYTVGENDNRT